MKKILFFDTETTGLPNYNERARHPSQPHLCEFSALMFDESGAKLSDYSQLVKPSGWTISRELTAIHGISHEQACMDGMPEIEVANVALRLIREADYISAYNLQFDKFLIRIALRRYNLMQDSDDAYWKAKPGICTMRAYCKAFGGKFPKLQEAYFSIFKRQFDGAHTGQADCQASSEIFFWLVKNNHLKL